MGYLDGKAVLITGGGSGIGAATAEICAREGAKISVADINEHNGTRVADSINSNGGRAIFVDSDVTSETSVAEMVNQTVTSLGGLDGAFNNAGIVGDMENLDSPSLGTWNQVLAVNLTGVWLCANEEIAYMKENGGGSIVNTSSIAGLVGSMLVAYSASKHGVVGITRSLARIHGAMGVRVNAVCPGVIETPLAVDSPLFTDADIRARSLSRHALGRYGQPSEVGELVSWLLSDAASFVTGAAFPIDAGYTA